MSHELKLDTSLHKKEQHALLLVQLKDLIKDEPDLIANLANVAAVIKEAFDPLWIGFYLLNGKELVLGPFQGPLACTRISLGKGVCGTAAENKKSILVPNVDDFPGHIACSSESRSELVVPIYDEENLYGVIDIDSVDLNHFDSSDLAFYESLSKLLLETCFR